jgi:hypothetical protein
MNITLYNPIHDAAKIMTTPALIMNTQEKRRAFSAIGKTAAQNQTEQTLKTGTLLAQTKIRNWNLNPVSDEAPETPATPDITSLWIFRILLAGAVIVSLALTWKFGKKLFKKSKK